jgi:HEAT repeat protein
VKPRVIFGAIISATLCVLVLVICFREPRYHGRTLTSWLQQYDYTPLNESQRRQEAQDAVRAIGAKKALPKLLNLLEAKDDPVSLWLIDKTGKFRIQFFRWSSSENYSFEDYERIQWHSAEDFQQLGIAGFEVLGTNTAPAVGQLTKLLNDDKHVFTAISCLIFIGTPAEASVCQAFTNKNSQVRYFATQQFAWVTDDDKVFLARMRDCLKDPDASVRSAAVQGIGAQTQAPEEAVPLLMSVLEKNDGNISSGAAGVLANFGTNAVKAFPVLSNIVESGSPDATTHQALKTLVAIAPDEALPIVFKSLRSFDKLLRHISFSLLCKYPVETVEIQSAIERSASDSDPALARQAREFITGQYQKKHPLESQFLDDPSYEGRRLGEWLTMYERQSDYAYSKEATNAIHHIGTNAIPALLRRLVYVEPPFGLPAYEVNMDAVRGFITLGEQANPALPQLQALLDGTNRSIVLYAMVAALGTGTNAIPVLSKGLTNQFADVRSEAAHNLTEGIADRFPEHRKEIISLLTNLLNDSDPDVRLTVKGYLQEMNPTNIAKAKIE